MAGAAVLRETLAQDGLRRLMPLPQNPEDPDGWRTATWSPEQRKAIYGCRACQTVGEAERLRARGRRRAPTPSSGCFAYGSVSTDVRRVVRRHSTQKVHVEACRLAGDVAAVLQPRAQLTPQQKQVEWRSAAFLAL